MGVRWRRVTASSALDLPRARLTDVSSHLVGFSITTFDVDPSALRAFLPRDLTPHVGPIDGKARAFVSAVSFENTRFYVHFAPFVKLRCFQTNYRAYVRRGDEEVVWFFGTSLGSMFVHLPRLTWGLPWHRTRGATRHRFTDGRCERFDWEQHAPGKEERLLAKGTGEKLGHLPGFRDEEETWRLLTHPLEGFVRTTGGKIATYGVRHGRLDVELAEPEIARYEWFESLGLVREGQRPHSVLVLGETDFLVRLPPRRVASMG